MYAHLPHFLKKVGSIFSQAGFSVYLVGGAVRNIVNNQKPVDYDLATDAMPEDVMKLFSRVIPTGIKHGTVTVLFKNHPIEVTTFRIDGTYSNRRHPDSVSFTPSIEKDLERRDFTINSMAFNLNSGELLDPHNGREDLRNKVIRAIGNPEERFSEDGLRLLRACRFAAQLEFRVDKVTQAGMLSTHEYLHHVSVERIRSELEKILAARQPSIAFRLMDETSILQVILPDLSKSKGIGTKGPNCIDVFDHSLLSCDGAPPDNLSVRLAALFHDLGKVKTYTTENDGSVSFIGHETESEITARRFLRYYKFPRNIENRVCHLILHHMFFYSSELSDAAIRRLLYRIGPDYINDIILLRKADHFGMDGLLKPHPYLDELHRRIIKILDSPHALEIKDLEIDGTVLHSELGIPRSPVMGKILDMLLETVIDDPSQNTRDNLLQIAQNLFSSMTSSIG